MSSNDFEVTLAEYLSPFQLIERVQFQVSSVDIIDSDPLLVKTTIRYTLVGPLTSGKREERSGEWGLQWRRDGRGKWTAEGWNATSESRVRLTGSGFVDITASCLGANRSFTEQLQHGIDYWRTLLDGACGVDIYGNNGISVGDFDGDLLDDIYICQPAGLPNLLYRNRGDGSFEDVTDRSGVGVLDATSSAIFADLTNNGRQDLIVVRTNGPLLFVNRGDGTFEFKPNAFRCARPPQGAFTGVAVADYDRDGLLDVYFCLYSYYQGLSEYQFPTPYYDAQNGPPNFLFKNRGDGTFVDVTESAGLDKSNNRYTLACSWNDYNNDGWPDLYVVNDFGRKVLYKNNGDGTLTDVSAQAGVEDPGEGMSMTWFDYDNDGCEDIYVVNMWDAAGKRVTTQKQFLPFASEEIRGIYQQDSMGNKLLHNEKGNGTFRDSTEGSGTQVSGWNWGSESWDVDNDGYPDLYVVNGFISGQNKSELSSFFWRQVVSRSLDSGGASGAYEQAWSVINECIRSDYTWSGYQRNNFYLNNRDSTFSEAAGALGLDCLEDGRSFALSDLDGDGCLEVVIKNRTAPQVRIFSNELHPRGSAISVSLKGTKSNRDAIGAVVELEAKAGRQTKMIRAGSGFLMQHTKVLHFGLGDDMAPVRAVVRWPSGEKQIFENLPPGRRIEIEEGRSTFKAIAFKDPPSHKRIGRVSVPEDIPPVSETWLLEPISAPLFRLADANGKTYDLNDTDHRPLLLVFCQPGCEESERFLQAIQKSSGEWQQRGLGAWVVEAPAPKETPSAPSTLIQHLPFPVLYADQQTARIYDIFYRYLFERRRDMCLPTSFLLDEERQVVKVYSGPASPLRILSDSQSKSFNADERLRRALPFPGRYFGNGLHHNYFTYGVAFLQYDFLDQALSSFQATVKFNPSHAGAYYNMGLIYLNKNMLVEAKTNLSKAVDLDPSDANAWNNLGVAYGEDGEYEQAGRNFAKALNLHPAHVLALQNCVKLYEYQGRLEEARKILEQALDAEPLEAENHLSFALFLAGQNDLVGAKREFEQTIKIQPGNPEALNGVGVILMKTNRPSEAISYLEQCRKLNPDFDRAYLNLASLYLAAGNSQKAHEVLSEFKARHPENAEINQALKETDGGR